MLDVSADRCCLAADPVHLLANIRPESRWNDFIPKSTTSNLSAETEIVWAYTMKLSQGFTRPAPTAATILVLLASFALLSLSMKTLPLGTAYTVWTGIGGVGAFVVGVVMLGEH
jgi:multidrug transporter EmrE-like cation transporter